MDTSDLKNKLVAVMGYGVEGKATTAYLLKHGIKPVLFDQRPWSQWDEIKKLEIKKLGINFIFGPDAFLELKGFDVAFRSPGIALSKFQIPNSKFQVTSQTKWFFDNCPAKIIGVTGTKGKGTTASLIYEILKTQFQIPNSKFQNIYLTGNIGKTQPLEILDGLKSDDWVVYELSSFQLQDLNKSPHIGAVLMVTSEHLDYHKDNAEYVSAKEAIVKFQGPDDFAVINADFEASKKIGQLSNGKKLYFSRERTDVDCYVKSGTIVMAASDSPILRFSDLTLRGEHNLENICAAILAAHCAGAGLEAIKQAAVNFKGLEHRLEFVAEKNGVKFYNDSFSTTPETAIAAIKSFGEPLILILGGSSKNSDFTEMGNVIGGSKNIKAVILAGEEAVKIKSSVNSYKVAVIEGAKNMAEIFSQISSVAQKGDVVLLSPACASFGMFKNYKDRGEQFKKFVDEF